LDSKLSPVKDLFGKNVKLNPLWVKVIRLGVHARNRIFVTNLLINYYF